MAVVGTVNMLLLDRCPPKNQDDLGSRARNLSCGYATCTVVTTTRMHRHLMGNRERAGQGTQGRLVRVLSRDHGHRNAILKGRQAGRWATRPWVAATLAWTVNRGRLLVGVCWCAAGCRCKIGRDGIPANGAGRKGRQAELPTGGGGWGAPRLCPAERIRCARIGNKAQPIPHRGHRCLQRRADRGAGAGTGFPDGVLGRGWATDGRQAACWNLRADEELTSYPGRWPDRSGPVAFGGRFPDCTPFSPDKRDKKAKTPVRGGRIPNSCCCM